MEGLRGHRHAGDLGRPLERERHYISAIVAGVVGSAGIGTSIFNASEQRSAREAAYQHGTSYVSFRREIVRPLRYDYGFSPVRRALAIVPAPPTALRHRWVDLVFEYDGLEIAIQIGRGKPRERHLEKLREFPGMRVLVLRTGLVASAIAEIDGVIAARFGRCARGPRTT